MFFHPDTERMTTESKNFLTFLQRITPGLSNPTQTCCICLQYDKVRDIFDK